MGKIGSKVGPLSDGAARPKPHTLMDGHWNHASCVIEGASFGDGLWRQNMKGNNMQNTYGQPLTDKDTYYNWVEVVDGRLTFEDHGGYYGYGAHGGYTCDNINSISIFKQVGT